MATKQDFIDLVQIMRSWANAGYIKPCFNDDGEEWEQIEDVEEITIYSIALSKWVELFNRQEMMTQADEVMIAIGSGRLEQPFHAKSIIKTDNFTDCPFWIREVTIDEPLAIRWLASATSAVNWCCSNMDFEVYEPGLLNLEVVSLFSDRTLRPQEWMNQGLDYIGPFLSQELEHLIERAPEPIEVITDKTGIIRYLAEHEGYDAAKRGELLAPMSKACNRTRGFAKSTWDKWISENQDEFNQIMSDVRKAKFRQS